MAEAWDAEADVVVVGFGVAGACAAIEAAQHGADVLALDRFAGGGASVLSGGVVYAGGGTWVQRAAGVRDSTQAMYDYLRLEAGDAVAPETLRRFCEQSPAMIDWLAGNGVPFEASVCDYKTSYPSNRHYLYYSGSESAGGFRDAAPPAPRGHRARGRGTSGKMLFGPLADTAHAHGVRVRTQTSVARLVTDAAGGVTGVECASLTAAPAAVRWQHALLARYAAKPGLYVPTLHKRLQRAVLRLERKYARPVRIGARRGVVVAAGGFVANRELMREHAPEYRAGLPLGTAGDDGSGLRLGTGVGAATTKLGNVSAWRFISPPSALLGALAVDAAGARIIDESRYGAALGHAMVTKHRGKGWLLVDSRLIAEARAQLRTQTVWFQRLQTEYLLRYGCTSGATVEAAAAVAGIDPAGVRATLDAYNGAAREGRPDPVGKPPEFVRPLDQPPYSLLDISIKPSLAYPCPMLTLGGLVVDEQTGAVRDSEGRPIAGLYAAGRTAAGLCSNSYVSGLSLADCVFSGRRAGTHASAVTEAMTEG